jgi:hypothetical protein
MCRNLLFVERALASESTEFRGVESGHRSRSVDVFHNQGFSVPSGAVYRVIHRMVSAQHVVLDPSKSEWFSNRTVASCGLLLCVSSNPNERASRNITPAFHFPDE